MSYPYQKGLSGPLGLVFLFFFHIATLRGDPSTFHMIFGKKAQGFLKGKGEELLLTMLFSVLQTLLFFSFIFSVIPSGQVSEAFGGMVSKAPFIYLFSFLDMCFAFVFFYMLYYFLTPVRDKKLLLDIHRCRSVFFWYAGKYCFKLLHPLSGKIYHLFRDYGAFHRFSSLGLFLRVCFCGLRGTAFSSCRICPGNEPKPNYAASDRQEPGCCPDPSVRTVVDVNVWPRSPLEQSRAEWYYLSDTIQSRVFL